MPYFEVRPTNSRAARLSGIVENGEGVQLTIGDAAWRALCHRGGNIVKGASCVEEFRWICEAVLAGGFTEDLYYSSRGKLIRSEARLRVKGVEVVFGGRRRLSLPFVRRVKKSVLYEAYI